MTAKERNLVKDAIRRVFSRSELRRGVLDMSTVAPPKAVALNRPKVKTWCLCTTCEILEAKSYMEVDHKDPVVPIKSTLKDMTWDEVVDRIWCEVGNLQPMCKQCHKTKTKEEQKQRREIKNEAKRSKKSNS